MNKIQKSTLSSTKVAEEVTLNEVTKNEKLVNENFTTKFNIDKKTMLDKLTSKQIDSLEKKIVSELVKIDRNSLNEKFKGLPSIFNFIKKESEIFKSDLNHYKVQPIDVLSTLSLNQVLNLSSNGAKYSLNLVHELIKTYCLTYNKALIKVRSNELNTLIMQGKKEFNKELILAIFSKFSKEDRKELSLSNAKLILSIDKNLFLNSVDYSAYKYGKKGEGQTNVFQVTENTIDILDKLGIIIDSYKK